MCQVDQPGSVVKSGKDFVKMVKKLTQGFNVYYYTNICTNKQCRIIKCENNVKISVKLILKSLRMLRCQYIIFRQFTVVLAEVMDC